jgi:hypothetical protein
MIQRILRLLFAFHPESVSLQGFLQNNWIDTKMLGKHADNFALHEIIQGACIGNNDIHFESSRSLVRASCSRS